MKRIILGVGLFILCMRLCAQQEYFIFIQEGSGTPFYARIGEKNYSSASTGHLIISSLTDSVYAIYIGFPRNQYPEQLFSIAINRKDRGFDLKKEERGWELFDLQNLQALKTAAAGAAVSEGIKKTDTYSQLMAGVVDDSAVLYTSAAKIELPVKNSASAINAAANDQEKKPTPMLTVNAGAQTPIKKEVREAKDSSGKELAVHATVKPDTGKNKPMVVVRDSVKRENTASIVLLKPDTVSSNEQSKTFIIIRDNVGKPISIRQPKPVSRGIIHISSTSVSDGSRLIYIDQGQEPSDTIIIIIPAGEIAERPDTLRIGSQPKAAVIKHCTDMASETDVDKLRVKMLAEKTEENKLMVARNAFKLRCFTTRQVRALSELFAGDFGRYQLLDAAYPFISDAHNFSAMADLLKEEYYINRFKTLVSR